MSSQPSPSTPESSPPIDTLFEQYKLALDMADRMSAKRQDANKFYIAIVSGFGGLYSLLDKESSSFTQLAWEYVLPILAVCWCLVWWLTIRGYRRINIAKWKVIEKLETKLPDAPFTWEGEELLALMPKRVRERAKETDKETGTVSPGSFGITKVEAAVPILVGLVFLLLAARPLLDLVRPQPGRVPSQYFTWKPR